MLHKPDKSFFIQIFLPREKCAQNLGYDFTLSKDKAFGEMYRLRSSEDIDTDSDYRYDISPLSFSDDNCLIFAVSNGAEIRILAASELKYIKAESRYNIDNIEIGETYISVAEFNEILSKLSI